MSNLKTLICKNLRPTTTKSRVELPDIFVTKYDANGNKQWTKLFGTPAPESSCVIAVHSTGNSYITRETEGGLDGETDAGLFEIFIWKFVGP